MKAVKDTSRLIDEHGEVRELTRADMAKFKPMRDIMPADFVEMALAHESEMEAQGKIKRTRGKQKAPTKQAITIRLSPEVIAAFKSTGKGWQSRINEVLLKNIP